MKHIVKVLLIRQVQAGIIAGQIVVLVILMLAVLVMFMKQ